MRRSSAKNIIYTIYKEIAIGIGPIPFLIVERRLVKAFSRLTALLLAVIYNYRHKTRQYFQSRSWRTEVEAGMTGFETSPTAIDVI